MSNHKYQTLIEDVLQGIQNAMGQLLDCHRPYLKPGFPVWVELGTDPDS